MIENGVFVDTKNMKIQHNGATVESIVENETGVFFDEESPEDINRAIEKLKHININPQKIREHVQKFSHEKLKKQFLLFLEEEYKKFKKDI